jgi:hypothetical protein
LGQRPSWRIAAGKTVMIVQRALRAGLVDFADPTFLLIGQSGAFDWLADQIERKQAVTLDGQAGKSLVRLAIIPTGSEGRASKADDVLEWLISPSEAALVAQQLRELAQASAPAHAYLDPANNLSGVQIVASKGEYDPAKVFDA